LQNDIGSNLSNCPAPCTPRPRTRHGAGSSFEAHLFAENVIVQLSANAPRLEIRGDSRPHF
jgi:hypothetical protein